MQDSSDSLSVIDLLYNHFLPEKLHADSNNQYYCNACQKQVESAHLTQKLSKDMPPIIMVTLNRFYYDRLTQTRKKRLDPIALSYSITISKEFIEIEDQEPEQVETSVDNSDVAYDLYAIIIHSGVTAHSGHYYTIAKDDINSNERVSWKSYNDSMVSDVDEDFILTISKKMKYDTPYILFFKKREQNYSFSFNVNHNIEAKADISELMETDSKISEQITDAKPTQVRELKRPELLVDESGKINIPETLKKFIETDNESYLKEKEYLSIKMNKNQYNSKDFNFALLKELQKHLMRNNDKGFDEARTMGPGGFGGYGNNSDFGGGGGV